MQRALWQVGELQVQTFGFFISLGILAGILVSYRAARQKQMADEFLDFVTWALILGVAGARLAFIFTSNPAQFISNPEQILRMDLGGLSIQGAILGGIIAGIWFSRRRKISFWRLADVVAPGLILAQAIGRVGCDVFGYAMARPEFWGVKVDGSVLHPVQIYESLLDYAIFAFLWLRRDRARYDGRVFIEYLFLFSLARGTVEFFRINPLVWGPFSVAHEASLLMILGSGAAHFRLREQTTESSTTDSSPTEPSTASNNTAEPRPWLVALSTTVAATVSVVVFYAFPPV